MQLSYFTNGGYVIHKALDGKTSAWFDENGQLVDAERINTRGQSRAVTDHNKKALQSIYGNRHNFKDWNTDHCNNKK